MIPLLIGVFLIIVIRALTLPGAFDGLEAFFKPDFSKILNGTSVGRSIWTNFFQFVDCICHYDYVF